MQAIEFIKKFPTRVFEKGSMITPEGMEATEIYALQSGFVKVSTVDGDGSEQLVWIAGRYDLVPAELLFSKKAPMEFFYTAMSDVEAYAIPKPEFLAHASSNLAFMSEIARGMSVHYDDLLYRLRSVEQTKAKDKIAHTLYHLGRRFSAEEDVNFHDLGLEMTHQEIADMVGMTRETTSLELSKLRAEKYIDYNRSKLILHMSRLETIIQ